MPTTFDCLPELWLLQPGEQPTPASEAASAAPDVTPEAVALGIQLRQQLADAAATADLLVAATGEGG